MQWYPMHVSDFTMDTIGWPNEVIGILIKLMHYQWSNEFLPSHQKKLARIASVEDPDHWSEMWQWYLNEKFSEISPGKLVNNRLRREYLRIQKKNKQARDAVMSRWNKDQKNNDMDTDVSSDAVRTKNIEQRTNNNSPTGRVAVPLQKIVDLYHEHCPQLPACKVLSDKRKAQLRARWKTFEFTRSRRGKDPETIAFNDLSTWERYFKFITERCPFMNGDNDRGWVANFDFVIRESGMIGVMENKYVRKQK